MRITIDQKAVFFVPGVRMISAILIKSCCLIQPYHFLGSENVIEQSYLFLLLSSSKCTQSRQRTGCSANIGSLKPILPIQETHTNLWTSAYAFTPPFIQRAADLKEHLYLDCHSDALREGRD